jgi:uncharacterized protein YqgC (DUF456 family)
MEIILMILAIVLGAIGLVGAVVPVIPGTILSYCGLLCIGFVPACELSVAMLLAWGVVTVVVMVADYFLPAYFSKVCGGTKAGITGATIGAVLGVLFMNVLGIVLGPFIGAVAGEMISGKLPLRKAIVVGLGALMSFFVGTGVKLVVGIWMLCLIVAETWTLMNVS